MSRNKPAKAMKRDKSPVKQGKYTSIMYASFILQSVKQDKVLQSKNATHLHVSFFEPSEQEPSKWVHTPPSLSYEGNIRAKSLEWPRKCA